MLLEALLLKKSINIKNQNINFLPTKNFQKDGEAFKGSNIENWKNAFRNYLIEKYSKKHLTD